jgi:ferredoxin
MHIEVDKAKCIAAGQCVAQASEVFDQDDDTGIVVLLDAEPAGDLAQQADLAAQMCPARAIMVSGA